MNHYVKRDLRYRMRPHSQCLARQLSHTRPPLLQADEPETYQLVIGGESHETVARDIDHEIGPAKPFAGGDLDNGAESTFPLAMAALLDLVPSPKPPGASALSSLPTQNAGLI